MQRVPPQLGSATTSADIFAVERAAHRRYRLFHSCYGTHGRQHRSVKGSQTHRKRCVMTMRHSLFAAMAITLFSPLPAAAQSVDPPPAPHTVDLKAYVEDASDASLFDVKASQLALQRSQDPTIRKFAQQLVSEHTAATNKLKMELDKAKVDVDPPEILSPARQAMLDKLMNVGAQDFNKMYVSMQIVGQQEALNLHKAFGDGGQDNFRVFARDMTEQVKVHLDQAKQIDQEITN